MHPLTLCYPTSRKTPSERRCNNYIGRPPMARISMAPSTYRVVVSRDENENKNDLQHLPLSRCVGAI
jgi:acyl-coenzyme A synthetase/AMP-(fatty) acid ligase